MKRNHELVIPHHQRSIDTDHSTTSSGHLMMLRRLSFAPVARARLFAGATNVRYASAVAVEADDDADAARSEPRVLLERQKNGVSQSARAAMTCSRSRSRGRSQPSGRSLEDVPTHLVTHGSAHLHAYRRTCRPCPRAIIVVEPADRSAGDRRGARHRARCRTNAGYGRPGQASRSSR
jgi:hypothetical protein